MSTFADRPKVDSRAEDFAMKVPPRLKVIVPGFVAGIALALLCGGSVVMNPALWHQQDPPRASAIWLVLLGPAVGPFAAPLGIAEFHWPQILGIGAVLSALIALHPLRPGVWTGAVSGTAIAAWFLVGFSIVYIGV